MADKKLKKRYISYSAKLDKFIDSDMEKLGITNYSEYFRTLVRLRKEND